VKRRWRPGGTAADQDGSSWCVDQVLCEISAPNTVNIRLPLIWDYEDSGIVSWVITAPCCKDVILHDRRPSALTETRIFIIS